MISVPFPKKPSEEAVLDLCVRKAEKRCASPRQGFKRYVPHERISETDMGGLDLRSRGGADPRVFRPIVAQETGYSATLAGLQQRLYEDKLLSPPPMGSEHGDSMRSESPAESPEYRGIAAQVTPNTTRGGKPTRPFKAYPKDPMSLVSSASDGTPGESNEAYTEFRRRMLEQVHAATGGNTGNKNMKRPVQSTSPTNQQPSSSMDPKDTAYWERRRKNNEAAKRSRDARRAKEDEIAIRAAFLEQENVKLKYEVAALRHEASRLRSMLFSS